ncbi:MAG: pseudouridine synthase [Anaerolineales bacterium]
MKERLQKILARAGYGSRRSCEDIISAGRVRVYGKVAGLGDKADPATDQILVDGRALKKPEELVYVALYKPRGVISTVSDPNLRMAVRDLVPVEGTLYPVGRLDFDSKGLILMTNDGDLANKLTHPRYEHEKEYRVLVATHPDSDQLAKWRRGVVLEDGFKTSPADVLIINRFGKGAWLNVTLREGYKRQIREMGKVTGLPVVRIVRVRIGELHLGNLKPKEWRYLTPQEVSALKKPTRSQFSKSETISSKTDTHLTPKSYKGKRGQFVKSR